MPPRWGSGKALSAQGLEAWCVRHAAAELTAGLGTLGLAWISVNSGWACASGASLATRFAGKLRSTSALLGSHLARGIALICRCSVTASLQRMGFSGTAEPWGSWTAVPPAPSITALPKSWSLVASSRISTPGGPWGCSSKRVIGVEVIAIRAGIWHCATSTSGNRVEPALPARLGPAESVNLYTSEADLKVRSGRRPRVREMRKLGDPRVCLRPARSRCREATLKELQTLTQVDPACRPPPVCGREAAGRCPSVRRRTTTLPK